MNDPYRGDQAAEAADHDFNAQFDDVRERYMEHCPTHGAYAGDCGGCEAEHYARHGDDDDIHDSFVVESEPTDAEVRRARQSNIDAGRTTRLHPIGGDDLPF